MFNKCAATVSRGATFIFTKTNTPKYQVGIRAKSERQANPTWGDKQTQTGRAVHGYQSPRCIDWQWHAKTEAGSCERIQRRPQRGGCLQRLPCAVGPSQRIFVVLTFEGVWFGGGRCAASCLIRGVYCPLYFGLFAKLFVCVIVCWLYSLYFWCSSLVILFPPLCLYVVSFGLVCLAHVACLVGF